MPVDAETKRLLLRWLTLSKPGELQRVKSRAMTLWIFGLIVFLIVAIAIAKAQSPIFIVAGGMVVGWLIAETNALRSRIGQWDTFQRYLDWARIEHDAEDAA